MYGKHACMLSEIPKVALRPLASWWRRLFSSTRCLVLPAAWHYASKLYLRSQKALENECNRQLQKPCLVIHPYSPFKFYWDCYSTLIYFTTLMYMPFQVFYPCSDPYNLFVLFNDLTTFITIGLNFLTGSVDTDGKKIILEPQKIAQRYLKDTFFFDVVSALPLQCIQFTQDCHFPTHTVMFFFKLFRLIAVERVWKSLSAQFGFSYLVMMAITALFRMIIFLHWITFCHYQVPVVFAHIYEHTGHFLVWLERYKVVPIDGQHLSVLEKYIDNLYFASGICIGAGVYTTIRTDSQTNAELMLTATIAVIGLLFMTYFFTTLIRLFVYRHFESYLYNGRLKDLQEYLAFKHVPKALQQKIQLYINYRFNGHYFNEKLILNTINIQIKHEINMFCCKKLVINVPLFQDMPVALINTIIFSLARVLYMPGEVVVRYGHPGSSIYLISSGTVAIMNADGKEVGHLKDGAFFGEQALLRQGTPRAATIIALEITEIYKLNYNQFQACLQPCPRLKRRLEEMALNSTPDYDTPPNIPPPTAQGPPHPSNPQ